MAKSSAIYKRYTFGYVYKDDSEFYFSPFHYSTFLEASYALSEFLRICALDGDVVFSSVLSFDINVVGFSCFDFSNV